jgi:hypothetical protein
MIVRRSGKVTKKFIESVDSEPLTNVLNWNHEYEDARKFWTDHMQRNFWKIIEEETIEKWGKPNVNVMSYESAPGVWIFDDTELGIIWYIWTDLHHKNPWKGTAFEIFVPEKVTGPEMLNALKRFTDFLKVS